MRPTVRFKSEIDESLYNTHTMTNFKGYLFKYSPSAMKGWQKRYFVLRLNKLEYSHTEADFELGIHPLGII